MKNIAVVECVDNNFAGNMMCITSYQSIIKNINCADYYILTYDNNPFIFYYEKLGIHIIKINDHFNKYLSKFNSHNWCKFVYSRYLIFKYDIFRKYELVLYLDCDTFITQNIDYDINYINKNIKYIGMVPERITVHNINVDKIKRACLKNNIQYNNIKKYCNGGVAFIKNICLNDDNFKEILKLSQYSNDFQSNDQDIYNLFFADKIQFLDISYNLFINTYLESEWHQKNIQPTDQNVKIWHYAGYPEFNQKFNMMIQRFQSNINYFTNI